MIDKMLERFAFFQPGFTALVQGNRVVRYGELPRMIESLGSRLYADGVRPGHTIAVRMPNSIETALSVLAGARLGARILMLDYTLKPGEVDAYRCKADAVKILCAGPDAENLARHGVPAGVLLTVDAIQPVTAEMADSPQAAPNEVGPGREGGFLLLSSGTTGTPKIVVRTAAQTEAALDIFDSTLPVGTGDRVLCTMPFFHSFGLLYVLLTSLRSGAQLHMEPFSPRTTAATVERNRITILPAAPFMLRLMAETPFSKRPDFSSLRLAVSAGSALPAAVAAGFLEQFGVAITQSYGSTETGPAAVGRMEPGAARPGWIGKPYAGVVFEFAGSGAAGESGKQGLPISVRSPANAAGYLGDAAASAGVFRDGAVLTGDLGYRDGAGEIFILGRERPMLNVAGKKVSPAEVEACLRTHPQVVDVLVQGVPTPAGDERVRAVLVCRLPVTDLELRQFCTERLADFKAPREFVFVDNLSEGPLGKTRLPPTASTGAVRKARLPRKSWLRRRIELAATRILCLPFHIAPNSAFAMKYADISGRLRYRLSLGETPESVRHVFGDMPARRAGEIAMEITIQSQKAKLLTCRAASSGIDGLLPLVRCRGGERLLDLHEKGQGAIVIFAHMGPRFVSGILTAKLGIPSLQVRRGGVRIRLPETMEVWFADDSQDRVTLFLKRAVEYIRSGRVVVLALDGKQGGSSESLTIMGQTQHFSRGIGLLNSITGAPVIPVSGYWAPDGMIEIVVHEPLDIGGSANVPKGERGSAAMKAAVKWMESLVRERPGDLRSLSRFIEGQELADRKDV
ncbi:MAG: AMP-binding protein [bacterium]